jgi:hypothetical protein
LENLDPIVASRVLTLDGDDDVRIEFELPKQHEGDNGDYRCRYRITGLGADRISYAMGVDSLQALLLAVGRASNDLYASDAWRQGRLRWMADLINGDLGLRSAPWA